MYTLLTFLIIALAVIIALLAFLEIARRIYCHGNYFKETPNRHDYKKAERDLP